MIGLALVTLVSIMAAGIISNFKGAVNAQFGGDYAIVADNNFSPIPISAGEAAARAPGVIAVGSVRAGEDKVVRLDRQPDRRQPRGRSDDHDQLDPRLAADASRRWDPRARSCPRASPTSTTCRSARR